MKYEIRAVKLVDDNYERCDADDPNAVWGLYESGADNLPIHLSDHATREEAEQAMRDAQDTNSPASGGTT